MNKDQLITLGMCTKPHGIQGGFTFSLENSQNSVLKNGSKVFLFPRNGSSSIPEEGKEYTISKISFGNKTIVYFKDIVDRNVVESMIPFDIRVSRDIFPEPEEGEFYIADLIGMEVLEFETDRKLGKVVKYFDNGAQIILSIRGNTTFDIPFIDNFVPEVDVDANTMWVVVPEVV